MHRDPGCNYLTLEQISEMRGLGQDANAPSSSTVAPVRVIRSAGVPRWAKVGLFAGAMAFGMYFLLSSE